MVKFPTWKKIFNMVILTIAILIALLCGFLIGYAFGYMTRKDDAYSNIIYYKQISLELSSNETLNHLKQDFPEKLNFTQVLVWESQRLNFSNENIERHSNPLDILEYRKGRCQEFSILYVAICLANNIPARLVKDPNIDHAWAEVNPSKDDTTWIHVEVTDSCVGIQKGTLNIYDNPSTINNPSIYKNLQLVIAFQISEERQVQIIDRTSVYVK